MCLDQLAMVCYACECLPLNFVSKPNGHRLVLITTGNNQRPGIFRSRSITSADHSLVVNEVCVHVLQIIPLVH